MKYSNDCRRLSQLILTYRDSVSILDASSTDPLKPYKDLLTDLSINDPAAKERIVELLKYQHHLKEAQQLSEWIIPRFPVTGGTLAAKGIKQGPTYKLILNELRESWKKSHYQATESQLVDDALPHVLETLAATTDTSGTKSKQIATGVCSPPKKRREKE